MFRPRAQYVAKRDFSRKGASFKKGDPVVFRRLIMRWLYARRLIELAPTIEEVDVVEKAKPKKRKKTNGSKRDAAPRRPAAD